MINVHDSITIDKAFNKLNQSDKELLNKDSVDGLVLSKFSFAIDDLSQISSIDSYLKNLKIALDEKTDGIYNIYNYNDPANIKNKELILEGFNIAQHDSFVFCYNILADYDQGSMSLNWNKYFSTKLMKKLEKMSEAEYEKNKDKIQKEIDKKARQKYIEPKLIKLIVDIVVVYKKKV